MVLTVTVALLISSIIYRIHRERSAIIIRMVAGRMVQTVSTSCASIVRVWVKLVVTIREMM